MDINGKIGFNIKKDPTNDLGHIIELSPHPNGAALYAMAVVLSGIVNNMIFQIEHQNKTSNNLIILDSGAIFLHELSDLIAKIIEIEPKYAAATIDVMVNRMAIELEGKRQLREIINTFPSVDGEQN